MLMVFSRRNCRLVAAALIAVQMAACARTQNDAARTRNEGTAAGAVGGALLGAGLGALLGRGKGKNKAAAIAGGAALGALAGGALGRAHGDNVAKKKQEYVRTETTLDRRTASIRGQVAQHRAYNAQLRAVIARQQRQLAAIKASESPPGTTVAEFDVRTTVASNVADIDQRARSWQETIEAHKAAVRRSGEESRGTVQDGLNELTAQRDELLRHRSELISIGEQLKR